MVGGSHTNSPEIDNEVSVNEREKKMSKREPNKKLLLKHWYGEYRTSIVRYVSTILLNSVLDISPKAVQKWVNKRVWQERRGLERSRSSQPAATCGFQETTRGPTCGVSSQAVEACLAIVGLWETHTAGRVGVGVWLIYQLQEGETSSEKKNGRSLG